MQETTSFPFSSIYMRLLSSRSHLAIGAGSCLLVLGTAVACGQSNDNAAARSDSSAVAVVPGAPANNPTGAPGNAPATTMDTAASNQVASGMTMTQMNTTLATTPNPDKTLLEMMSNHHKGLVEMTHLAIEQKKGSPAVLADAKRLDHIQDAELDTMLTMLQTKYNTPYEPKVIPQNQAMVDSLGSMTGTAFDRNFYNDVVKHHAEAIAMLGVYLPRAQDARLKAMAERMKKDQQQQITEFKRKAQQPS